MRYIIRLHSIPVLTNLSVVLLRQNKFREAREYAEKAVFASDNNIESLFVLLACYIQDENFSDVLGACDKIIAIEANSIEAHNNRGLALEHLRRFAEALDSYERVITFNPDLAFAWLGKANVFS